jgi:2-dehydro-3-deoxygluconokinase
VPSHDQFGFVVPPRPPGASVDALTLGEALVAFIAADGLPLRAATQFRRTVVGAEFNVAAGLARLGHQVQFAGRIGDDLLGQLVEDACRANGIEGHLTRDSSAFTGVLVRDMQASRPTTVTYARSGSAGSRLCIQDLADCAVQNTRALHTTGITAVLSDQSLETVRWALAAARSAGAMVSFDPNVRWRLMHRERTRPVLAGLLANVDVLIAGADELAWLADRESIDDATAWALDVGPRLVVVKDGEHGARVSDKAGTASVAAVPVAVVDPVGAGDAFVAGFLSGLLQGRPVTQAVAEAHTVAALVVTTPGDTEGLPDAALRDAFTGQVGKVHR